MAIDHGDVIAVTHVWLPLAKGSNAGLGEDCGPLLRFSPVTLEEYQHRDQRNERQAPKDATDDDPHLIVGR